MKERVFKTLRLIILGSLKIESGFQRFPQFRGGGFRGKAFEKRKLEVWYEGLQYASGLPDRPSLIDRALNIVLIGFDWLYLPYAL